MHKQLRIKLVSYNSEKDVGISRNLPKTAEYPIVSYQEDNRVNFEFRSFTWNYSWYREDSRYFQETVLKWSQLTFIKVCTCEGISKLSNLRTAIWIYFRAFNLMIVCKRRKTKYSRIMNTKWKFIQELFQSWLS